MSRTEYQKHWHREYYQLHPETVKATNKRWQDANKEHVSEEKKDYYKANREAILAKKREYYQAKKAKNGCFPCPKCGSTTEPQLMISHSGELLLVCICHTIRAKIGWL